MIPRRPTGARGAVASAAGVLGRGCAVLRCVVLRPTVLRCAFLLAAVLPAAGCDAIGGADERLPDAAEVRAIYGNPAALESVDLRGNVVQLVIRQDLAQLRRGGSLWARVGPYVYLFAPPTRELFERFPAVAAVRVVTLATGEEEVARAMLRRDTLSEVHWRRSLNILGRALQEGTRRPSLLEELATWGEEYTEHGYNPEYVPE